MEFIASVRITSYLGLEDLGVKFERSVTDGALNQPTEGGALALPEAREHQRLVLQELITDCERATPTVPTLCCSQLLPPRLSAAQQTPQMGSSWTQAWTTSSPKAARLSSCQSSRTGSAPSPT